MSSIQNELLGMMKPCPFCGCSIENPTFTLKGTATGMYVAEIVADCSCGASITMIADEPIQADMHEFMTGNDALVKWNQRVE